MTVILLTALVLLGLCMGSFVEALTWRLHEQAARQEQGKKPDPKLSMSKGRSMCPNCHHVLGFWDLLPVISWLSLKGRCRYCHKPYGWHSPVIELTTAGLFLLSYFYWPYGFTTSGWVQFGLWLAILVCFVALTLYDLRWLILPNRLVYALIAVVGGQVAYLAITQKDPHLVWGALLGVACLAGLFYLLFQVSDGRWIGGGDVKLAIALGLLVGGPLKAILVLFFASIIGLLVSLPPLIKRKQSLNSKVPFGPFLIAATIIVYLFGSSLVTWYTRLLLHG
jgi:prepilin signal peptidase PulO-like enzyme (type II secretory pathway)